MPEEAPKADAAEELDPEPEEPDPDALEEALVVPLAETASPTSPASETIVPVMGAKSLVFESASSALCTVSRSLLTAARAEAMLASRSGGAERGALGVVAVFSLDVVVGRDQSRMACR